MDLTEIGRRARLLRLDKGWTQAQVGKRAHVTPNTIRGFEQGVLNTRWPIITAIMEALGTSIEALSEPNDTAKPIDPRLVELTDEDLRIARAYHDSDTRVRHQVVMTLLPGGHAAALPHRLSEDEAAPVPRRRPLRRRRPRSHKS